MSAFGGKADMTSYSTFGNCGHRAPHGSFMLCACFFAQSAMISVSPVHHFGIAATVIYAAKPPEAKCLAGATSSAPMRQFNVSYSVILEIVMLRQLIIAIAVASALGISFVQPTPRRVGPVPPKPTASQAGI